MSKQELKNELKSLALRIKETKKTIKAKQINKEYAGSLQCSLLSYKSEYRHMHIAYCLMRGTPLSKIESPREGNEPSMQYVQRFVEEYSVTKLYVFVRKDLSLAQQAVQAGHAIAVAVRNEKINDWKPENGTLVILQVSSREDLECLLSKVDKVRWHPFYEVDLNNELTAIAAYSTGYYFNEFDLADFENKCCKLAKRLALWK